MIRLTCRVEPRARVTMPSTYAEITVYADLPGGMLAWDCTHCMGRHSVELWNDDAMLLALALGVPTAGFIPESVAS